jgi:hypothetical protein
MQVIENLKYYIFHPYFSPIFYRSVVSFLHYLLLLERIPMSNIFINLRLIYWILSALYMCSFAGFTIYRLVIQRTILIFIRKLCVCSFVGFTIYRFVIQHKILTPWSRVLLEKLSGSAASQEILRFYGTRKFITALTSARHLSLSWANSIQSP